MCILLSVIAEPCYALGLLSILKDRLADKLMEMENVSSFSEAVDRVEFFAPDIVIVDSTIAPSEERLFDFLNVAKASSNILALGIARSKPAIQKIFAAGAKGYLLKSADTAHFTKAITTVASGGGYLDPGLITAIILEGGDSEAIKIAPYSLYAAQMSEREVTVLKRTAFGYSAKEIARALNISQKSVETYKARAAAKLGLASRSDIIRYANRSGWFVAAAEQLSARAENFR